MSLIVWAKESEAKLVKTLGPALGGIAGDVVYTPTFNPPEDPHQTILAMGKDALGVLQAHKVAPKNRTPTSLRGQVLTSPNLSGNFLVTYSCGVVDFDYRLYSELLLDFKQAYTLHSTGSLAPTYGEYRWVPEFSDTIKAIRAKYEATGTPVDVALDTETLGLDPYATMARLVCVQLTVESGKSDLVYFGSAAEAKSALSGIVGTQLKSILNSPKVKLRMANGKYDLHWLKVHGGIECTNFSFDTTLVGSILDENRSNGLDVHAKVYYPRLFGYSDDFDKAVDKSRMDLVPTEQLLLYAGGDTDATLGVAQAQKSELLQDPALTAFYVNILHPAARAFEVVEQGGVYLDMDAYKNLEQDLRAELSSLAANSRKVIGGRLWAKHSDDSKVGGMNLTKASLINDFMFSPSGLNLQPLETTLKSGEPSTALSHLVQFKDVPEAEEFVSLLQDYSSAAKTLSTYVTGFQKHIRSDGKFHPSYFLFVGNRDGGEGGTNTGRLSCKDPAFQCLAGDVLVLTDKGQVPIKSIVEGYERGEPYSVLTHTGKWKPVIGVYRNGIQPVFSVTSESAVIRSTANHPYLTGRGWVRTDQLRIGDTCYAHKGIGSTAQNTGQDQSDLLQLGADGAGLDESHPWDRTVFKEDCILGIEPAGEVKTYDLTIADSHSFVANGIIVHNTIPKHTKWAKAIRRCFPAPPGMLIMENDYSQGELRVAACIANEQNLINAYLKGMDLHALTAGQFFGYSPDEVVAMETTNPTQYAEMRQLGKAGNFGLLYGMQVAGFTDYAKTTFGVSLSLTEAQAFRDGFFAMYPGLTVYHNAYKAFARKHGYVRSPLGRVRHLPLINSPRNDISSQAERQSINAPVQSTLSDLLLWSMAIVHEQGGSVKAPPFGMIHDASYTYIPQDNRMDYVTKQVGVMENLPFHKVGWQPQLKFVADTKVGLTLADMHKV